MATQSQLQPYEISEVGDTSLGMLRMVLTAEEITEIQALLQPLSRRHETPEDLDFLKRSAVLAHRLPERLREFLNNFRLREREGLAVVSGYPVDDLGIGPTPEHWKTRVGPSSARSEEMLLVLCGALLGDAIGWSTQQDGRIVHDIFPIKGHEGEQLGSGSEQPLWWHTEDAFHPCRADYLGLMCLRNPDRVATTVGPIEGLTLDPHDLENLFQQQFTIKPDESHLRKNNSAARASDPKLKASYDRIEKMNTDPDKIALLYGDPESPYVRIDPYFMNPVGSSEAQQALDRLVGAIESHLADLVLEQGDILFVDNFRAVHGRRPFKARFDGTDRWLKRINVARDLRRSREARRTAESRVIL